jgi:hypothetical protein
MKMKGWTGITAAAFLILLCGCKEEAGPDLAGEITLSSQLHGTESYYLYGFSFESGELVRYPSQEDPVPDIINEGFPVMEGSVESSVPGFNTPARVNGFALVGEFLTWDEAMDFYNAYSKVEEGLLYQTVSDTVRLYQVWVQQTPAGKYAKMIIREIRYLESETGTPYNEVTLEYAYSPDGSSGFSCGCD